MPENDIDSLISQLQGADKLENNAIKSLKPVEKANVEDFIINQASELITKTSASIDTLNAILQAAPTPKDTEALAQLIQSYTSALETLTKLVITDKKNATAKELKQMEIDNRKKQGDNPSPGDVRKMSRDEVYKMLFENQPKDVEPTLPV